MVLLGLFLLVILSIVIDSVIKSEHQRKVDKQREEQRAEKLRAAELKEIEAEKKKAEAERKAEYKRMMAEQNIESLKSQKESAQALYADIEKLLEGDITEKQRISYNRQLMTLDDKIYRIDNKIAELTFKAEIY